MLNLFTGLFETQQMTAGSFLLCIVTALVIGCFLASIQNYKNQSSGGFIVTLALLPAIVAVVIMMVNGNVGTGIAVAGTFSLVRFRSLPGTAREIGMLFLAMATGLIVGMGYLAYAVLFAVVLGFATVLFVSIEPFGRKIRRNKTLRITIPEDLDYSEVFDDIFEKYTEKNELVSVKTANMGSMYKLTYDIVLKESVYEKKLMDAIRCRNGNLEIVINRQEVNGSEL